MSTDSDSFQQEGIEASALSAQRPIGKRVNRLGLLVSAGLDTKYQSQWVLLHHTNQDHRKHHAQPRNRHIPAQRVLQTRSHVAIALRRLPNHGDDGGG
jgi:hypothetical protein